MLKASRPVGADESRLHLRLYEDDGYRFLILSADGTDADAGAILIELDVVEVLATELLALTLLADEPPLV